MVVEMVEEWLGMVEVMVEKGVDDGGGWWCCGYEKREGGLVIVEVIIKCVEVGVKL